MEFVKTLSQEEVLPWLPLLAEDALYALMRQCCNHGPWDDTYWDAIAHLPRDKVIALMLCYVQTTSQKWNRPIPLDTISHEDACYLLQSSIHFWIPDILSCLNIERVEPSFWNMYRFKGDVRHLPNFPASIRYAFVQYHLDWCYTLSEIDFKKTIMGLSEVMCDWYLHVGYQTIQLSYIERHAPNIINLELWQLWKRSAVPLEQYYHVVHVLAQCLDMYAWEQDNDVQPVILDIPY